MSSGVTRVSVAQDLAPIQALSCLLDDLIAALIPQSEVELDLSGWNSMDVRIVQLVDAARQHAGEIGASLTLAASPGFDLGQLLARSGFSEKSEEAFWTQGDTCQ